MLKINFLGPVFGGSGYVSHSRQLLNALLDRDDVEVNLETQLPQGWEALVNQKEFVLDRDWETGPKKLIFNIFTPPYYK